MGGLLNFDDSYILHQLRKQQRALKKETIKHDIYFPLRFRSDFYSTFYFSSPDDSSRAKLRKDAPCQVGGVSYN